MTTKAYFRWQVPGHGLSSALVREQSYTEDEARIIGAKMGVRLEKIEGSEHRVRAEMPPSLLQADTPYL